MFDPKTFTYGFEMEVSDVPKSIPIPEHLGKWEYCECDIVNTKPPYRGICADPLGISPPVGGEINTIPTRGWQAQVDRIIEITDYLTGKGFEPVAGFSAHNHIHVHVPGLVESPEALRNLMRYIGDNQEEFISTVYPFEEHLGMHDNLTAYNYLRLDGGKLIPMKRVEKIIDRTTDLKSFIYHHRTAYLQDNDRFGYAPRYGINTVALGQIKTVEFRCFRGSFERKHLESCFHAVELFMDAALNNGKPMVELFAEHEFEFPPMQFDAEIAQGWLETKHPSHPEGMNTTAEGKNREYIHVN